MSGVKLVNETNHDIILQQGSGGIFIPLGTIRRGKVYDLKVDANDTYREYLCKLSYSISQEGEAVTLTSDDIAEYEQVTIRLNQEGDGLSYEPKKRESASPGLLRRLFNPVFNKFGWQTPTDGGGGGGGGGGGAPDNGGNTLSNV